MSEDAKPGVNRLLDIVVEEVSLVDRAANKHRFLIVKRSNEMDESMTDNTNPPSDDAVETDVTTDSEGDAPADSTSADTSSTPLAIAVSALEGLTETVELLGSTGDDDANPRLAELAGELRSVSARLAQAAGGKPADGSDADAPTEPANGAGVAQVIEALRATLGRVDALLTTSGDDDNNAEDGTAAQLVSIAESLRALTGTVKEQHQRLARLEKRSGLPNSTPSGERPAKPDDEDVGWPMDLNRPFDRESVDKATSFHDA